MVVVEAMQKKEAGLWKRTQDEFADKLDQINNRVHLYILF